MRASVNLFTGVSFVKGSCEFWYRGKQEVISRQKVVLPQQLPYVEKGNTDCLDKKLDWKAGKVVE